MFIFSIQVAESRILLILNFWSHPFFFILSEIFHSPFLIWSQLLSVFSTIPANLQLAISRGSVRHASAYTFQTSVHNKATPFFSLQISLPDRLIQSHSPQLSSQSRQLFLDLFFLLFHLKSRSFRATVRWNFSDLVPQVCHLKLTETILCTSKKLKLCWVVKYFIKNILYFYFEASYFEASSFTVILLLLNEVWIQK